MRANVVLAHIWLIHFELPVARAHVHTPLLYLRNLWSDCDEIWYVNLGLAHK